MPKTKLVRLYILGACFRVFRYSVLIHLLIVHGVREELGLCPVKVPCQELLLSVLHLLKQSGSGWHKVFKSYLRVFIEDPSFDRQEPFLILVKVSLIQV